MLGNLKRVVARRIYDAIRRVENEEVKSANTRIKAKLKACGRGVGLWGPMHISGIDQVVLGDNVHIGANAYIRAEGGLAVGENTHISRNLLLYTINHRTNGDRIPYDEEMEKRPVVIGKNVWIGMNVCIAPGTRIGDGAIVGMGSVISGEVPPLSVVGSSKWRIIGTRDKAHYESCMASEAYAGPSGRLFVREEGEKDGF